MNKYYLPIHIDSGNRGCEAITRGTAKILKHESSQFIVYSKNIELDKKLGLNNVATLIKFNTNSNLFINKVITKIKVMISKIGKTNYTGSYIYNDILRKITSRDIVLSTGGDMLCYKNNQVIYINEYLHKRNIKSILWGCSIGEENLTPEKINTLKKFFLITARESLTKQMLETKLHLDNVKLYPDPAFVLDSDEFDLPKYLKENEMIGINLSNFVGANVGFDTMFGKNVLRLVSHIISNTSLNMVFVPHVFWEGHDDRIICKAVYNEFKDTGRVYMLDTYEMNYCQIRYAISKCRFFIGARTHAMISAYSMCIPALALGYSIKSRGIANDLGLPEELVVNYKSLKSEKDLISAFQYLYDNEQIIRNLLTEIMPSYRDKAFEAKDIINKLKYY